MPTFRQGSRIIKLDFPENRQSSFGSKRSHRPSDVHSFPMNQQKAYELSKIQHWLTVFLDRFFATEDFVRRLASAATDVSCA